jgi:hypothetical protein
MAIVRLESNKPRQITLKYKGGMEKPGRYGMEYLYKLENGDVLYLPPVAHAEIQALHVDAGEPFVLLKSEESSKITWTVERILQPGPKLVKKSKAELMNDLGTVLTGAEQKQANTVNRFYLERATRLIDVFAEANKYAAEHHGGAVTKDDVRSLVLSVFIQCTPKVQANGTRG